MKTYEIQNLDSGVVLGTFEGETAKEALDSFAYDSGYETYNELRLAAPDADDAIGVTEVAHIEIRDLIRTDGGTYSEGTDMLSDMLNGDPQPPTMADMIEWLQDKGYEHVGGFVGWGAVMRHEGNGDTISVIEID